MTRSTADTLDTSPQARLAVTHHTLQLDGLRIFYRAAGEPDAPVLLLPHGYPSSSYHYRRLMPALADRWRLLAPDYPGFGYSDTPAGTPGFAEYTDFLEAFAQALGLRRYALWLHDYGSQIGLRLAMRQPGCIAGIVVQNGDIYEDQLGPKYAAIRRWWADPSAANRRVLEDAVSEEGFRDEFVSEVPPDVAQRVPPDTWKLHWMLMDTPARRAISLGLMDGLKDNLAWFPRYQAYLREHRPGALILWGPCDGFMPEGAARAWLRDLPDAELHLLPDAGHGLLETHLEVAVPLVRRFLQRCAF